MKTYTITVVSDNVLNELNDGNYAEFADPPVSYGSKTYTGFVEIEKGIFAGAYQGYADGDDVVFYGNELTKIEEEK